MPVFDNIQVLNQDSIPVDSLLQSPAKLEPLTGDAGLSKKITNKHIYRPQLALSGYVGFFNFKQVQIFGNTEYFYLSHMNKEDRIKSFLNIINFNVPCIIMANGNKLEDELLEMAIEKNIAVLSTSYDTTRASFLISEFLDDQFSQQAVIHGSFVDVYGIGVLFIGKSGIGKSEIALDLIERGHRLVADDIVMLTKKRETILLGSGTSLVQHFMEIRGLGIIDVRQMFGIRAIRFQKRLEIIVELQEWNAKEEYTRIGLDEQPVSLMGCEISTIKLPIFPGKNITVIAEVIAINYLLRTYGYNAAKIFSDKLQEEIQKKTGIKHAFQDKRIISWFQGDIE